jgi:hypothetical protein
MTVHDQADGLVVKNKTSSIKPVTVVIKVVRAPDNSPPIILAPGKVGSRAPTPNRVE